MSASSGASRGLGVAGALDLAGGREVPHMACAGPGNDKAGTRPALSALLQAVGAASPDSAGAASPSAAGGVPASSTGGTGRICTGAGGFSPLVRSGQ